MYRAANFCQLPKQVLRVLILLAHLLPWASSWRPALQVIQSAINIHIRIRKWSVHYSRRTVASHRRKLGKKYRWGEKESGPGIRLDVHSLVSSVQSQISPTRLGFYCLSRSYTGYICYLRSQPQHSPSCDETETETRRGTRGRKGRKKRTEKAR